MLTHPPLAHLPGEAGSASNADPAPRTGSTGGTDPVEALRRQMDRRPVPHGIRETDVETAWSFLALHGDSGTAGFWLSAARIAEMAILCAGHYADNGEFDGAGDLLVTPRRVHLYQKGYPKPILKPRRASVSEALGLADAPAGVRRRHLLHRTIVHVDRGPVIPEMVGGLQRSGRFPESYLERLQQRMKRVAATIAFLSAWSLPASQDLHQTLHCASTETRAFVFAHLCLLQGNTFRRLGDDLHRLRQDPSCPSDFLLETE